jgi:hypothetical protein
VRASCSISQVGQLDISYQSRGIYVRSPLHFPTWTWIPKALFPFPPRIPSLPHEHRKGPDRHADNKSWQENTKIHEKAKNGRGKTSNDRHRDTHDQDTSSAPPQMARKPSPSPFLSFLPSVRVGTRPRRRPRGRGRGVVRRCGRRRVGRAR